MQPAGGYPARARARDRSGAAECQLPLAGRARWPGSLVRRAGITTAACSGLEQCPRRLAGKHLYTVPVKRQQRFFAPECGRVPIAAFSCKSLIISIFVFAVEKNTSLLQGMISALQRHLSASHAQSYPQLLWVTFSLLTWCHTSAIRQPRVSIRALSASHKPWLPSGLLSHQTRKKTATATSMVLRMSRARVAPTKTPSSQKPRLAVKGNASIQGR